MITMKLYEFIIICCLITISQSWKLRIISGEVAESGTFPYLVSLQWIAPSEIMGHHFCGGSIIARSWVLSASHCIEVLNELDSSYYFIVAAGKQNLTEIEDNEQRVFVKSYHIHQEFKSDVYVGTNDIALIKLSKPLKLSKWIMPIDLPEKNSEPNGYAIISGWGAIRNFKNHFDMPRVVHFQRLPIIDRNLCNQAVEAVAREDYNNMIDTVYETDICTGPLMGGYSMCKGDSGGPLASLDVNGKWVLIGVSTWGMMPCGRKGAPSVYTRVSSYVNWIHSTIKFYN